MNDFDKQILEEVRQKAMQKELNDNVIYGIQDLELLIERHTQGRYHEVDYKIGFKAKPLYDLVLDKENADNIVYFLFYLLFNFADRAGYTSHAIKKCYGYNILEGCCCGIKIYMNIDDFATINLIEGIVNHNLREEVSQDVLSLIESVRNNGLPYSKDYVEKNIW